MTIRFLYILFISFSVFQYANAQEAKFPNDWLGHWSGELEIYSIRGKLQTVPMELVIGPSGKAGHWNYRIVYGTENEDVRSYELIAVDDNQTSFVLDEKNGIRIQTYLINDQLLSQFSVMGTMIFTATYPSGGNLIYEIRATSVAPYSITGDTIIGKDTIPPVEAFPVNAIQRAVLTRKK